MFESFNIATHMIESDLTQPICLHFLLVIPAPAGIHSGWEDGYLPLQV
jgi:hypothetical protein